MPDIRLRSSDGETFDVDVEIAKCSNTIRTMIEDLGMNDEDKVVPLPNVTSHILSQVIQWATHHKDDDFDQEDRDESVSQWDAKFLAVDQKTLVDLILAANYLDIKGLLDATCKTVANMMKGKTAEEIRETFNIQNDLSPAEEEQLRKETEGLKALNEQCEELRGRGNDQRER